MTTCLVICPHSFCNRISTCSCSPTLLWGNIVLKSTIKFCLIVFRELKNLVGPTNIIRVVDSNEIVDDSKGCNEFCLSVNVILLRNNHDFETLLKSAKNMLNNITELCMMKIE